MTLFVTKVKAMLYVVTLEQSLSVIIVVSNGVTTLTRSYWKIHTTVLEHNFPTAFSVSNSITAYRRHWRSHWLALHRHNSKGASSSAVFFSSCNHVYERPRPIIHRTYFSSGSHCVQQHYSFNKSLLDCWTKCENIMDRTHIIASIREVKS